MFALLFATFLTADVPVPVEPQPVAAKPAPRIITASVDGDKLMTQAQVYEQVPVTVEKEVIRNGKKEKIQVTEYIKRAKTVKQSIDLKKATITTAGGKKLTLDDLKKPLAKPAPVVISSDGKAVDPSYLKILDKDTIVIVIGAEEPKKPKE